MGVPVTGRMGGASDRGAPAPCPAVVPPSPGLLRPLHLLALGLLVLALLGVGAALAGAGTVPALPHAPLWPLTAVAVAASLLVPTWWVVLGTAAACLVSIPWNGALAALAAALAALLGVAIGHLLLRRDGGPCGVSDVPSLLRAEAVLVAVLPLATGTLGYLVTTAAGPSFDRVAWLTTVVAESVACLLAVLPMMLWWSSDWPTRSQGRVEGVALAGAATLLLVGGSLVALLVGGFPLGYLILLPLVWVAMRWHVRGVVLSVLLVSAVVGAVTVSGNGNLARSTEFSAVFLVRYWLLLAVLVLGGALIALVTRQRDLATHDLARENAALAEDAEERARMLDTLLSNLPGVAYRCRNDAAYTALFVSGGVYDVYGLPLDEVRGNRISLAEPIHPDDLPVVQRDVAAATAAHRPFRLQYRIRRADGELRWVWEQGRAIGVDDDGITLLEGFIYDVTDRVRSERLLLDEARILDAAMAAGSADDVLASLAAAAARHAEAAQVVVLAVDRAGLVGGEHPVGASGDWWPRTGQPLGAWEPARAGVVFRVPGSPGDVVIPAVGTDSRVVAVVGRRGGTSSEPGAVAATTHLARVAGAALSHVEAQQHLREEALFDALTRLPNRYALETRVETMLTAQPPTSVGLLFLDVSGFHVINETYGHPVGDTVLAALAGTTAASLTGSTAMFRFTGDQFVVVVGEDDPDALVGLARTLQADASGPYRVGQQSLHLSVTVGIAIAGPDVRTADELVTAAASACAAARETGRDAVRLYDAGLRDRSRLLLHTESGLRRALAGDEIETWFQPEFDLATGALIGAEALARWRSPDGRLIPPIEFIPVAESTGLVGPLGLRVLADACAQAVGWPGEPGAEPMVAVNVATSQLLDPAFPDAVADALGRSGLAPHRLCLEITETALEDADVALSALQRLRALGVRLAIDDFGTGYSSLSRLKGFPVDFLKIDRSFVSGIGVDPDDTAIVDAVCALARSLRLATIAEGVETEEQAAQLRARGVTFAQGYLWSRPVPAEDLMTVVRAGTAPR